MISSAAMLLNNGICARKISSAILLALGLSLGMADRVAAQPRQEESGAIVANPLQWISLDRLPATRDRPLFSPSRRPPTVIEATSTPPPPPPPLPPVVPVAPPSLTFFGTFESNEEVGADVQTGPNGNATIVRFGSYIEGWRVTEISRYHLVLSLDDRTAEFTLFSPKGSGSQPTINQKIRAGEPQPRLDAAGQNANKGIDRRQAP
jgi:general secretion pathway protein N